MSKVAIIAVVALLATAAFAHHNCPTTPNVFTRPSTACAGYAMCEAQLCNCTTGSVGMNGVACLANTSSTMTCGAISTCLTNQVKCLTALAARVRSNASDPCQMWAVSLQASVLGAAASTYVNSTLQQACSATVCRLANLTGRGNCDFGGSNYSTVCSYDNVVGFSTSAPSIDGVAPVSAVVAVVAALVALLI